jgi:hypothetical protein
LYLKKKSENYLKEKLFGLARVPAARIKQYTQEKYGGPDDIALVRTKTTVIFEPGLVMPVGAPLAENYGTSSRVLTIFQPSNFKCLYCGERKIREPYVKESATCVQ